MIKTVILIILSVCSPLFAQMNLSDLTQQTRYLVNDTITSRSRFSTTTIEGWINEGQKISDVKSQCIQRSYIFTLSTTTIYYQMPDSFITAYRVTRDSLAIQEMTPQGLDGRSAQWEDVSGLPTYYFINFSSRTMIGFAPHPTVVTDTATIKVDYLSYSNDLTTNSTTYPFNGSTDLYAYHYSLSYYAAYKASIIDERYEKTKAYLEIFTSMAQMMKETCMQRPNYRPSLIGKQ